MDRLSLEEDEPAWMLLRFGRSRPACVGVTTQLPEECHTRVVEDGDAGNDAAIVFVMDMVGDRSTPLIANAVLQALQSVPDDH